MVSLSSLSSTSSNWECLLGRRTARMTTVCRSSFLAQIYRMANGLPRLCFSGVSQKVPLRFFATTEFKRIATHLDRCQSQAGRFRPVARHYCSRPRSCRPLE